MGKIISGLFGLDAAKDMARATEKANQLNKQAFEAEQKSRRLEEKRRAMTAARERRQLAREARRARGDVEATAGATGTMGTSSFVTGAAGITAQAAQGQSFLNLNESISQNQSIFLQSAANYNFQAQQTMATARAKAAVKQATGDFLGNIFDTAAQQS